MKNLKKILLSLMVVFLVVGFIGCKTETDPVPLEPETPVTPAPVKPDPNKPGQEPPVTPDPDKPGQETPAVSK